MSYSIQIDAKYYCAKRSLRSSASQKQMFRPFVRSEVRKCGFWWFLPKEYEGWTHAAQQWEFETPILEVLKKKCQSYDLNGKRTIFWTEFERFFGTFSKKVKTSYSGRLRAPAVHGVSRSSIHLEMDQDEQIAIISSRQWKTLNRTP